MRDHLQSRGTPWRHCANHVKVCGTVSKMDALQEKFTKVWHNSADDKKDKSGSPHA